jgi:hypothetical protein
MQIEIEKELLNSLYWGNQYSLKMISELCNITVSSIYRMMIEYNIERRSRKESHIYKRKPTSGAFKKGHISFFKGKTSLEDSRIPHGETHGMWKNNSTLLNYGKNGRRLKQGYLEKKWRKQVYLRDNYICQICKQRGTYLNAHHIKSWKEYPDERFNINNGITLCSNCHILIHKKR